MRRNRSLVALVLVTALMVGACGNDDNVGDGDGSGPSGEGAPLRVAVLFPGRVDDQAFNEAGFEALNQSEETYNLETAYSEAVPQAQYESTMRSYADQDFDLVIGNGFQFQDAAEAVASEYPETDFSVIAGVINNDENLGSVTHQEWQAGYLAGVVAGSITDGGTIAYMGGVPIPPIAQFGNAYKLGAESVNPSVEVLLTYTGSFDDVAKGKQTALSLINQGADVVCANANVEGPAAIETAQEEGVTAIGALFDSTGVAPDTVVASGVVRYGVSLEKVIGFAVEGELKPQVYDFDINDGVIGLEWNPDFEADYPDAVTAVEEAVNALENDEIEAPSTDA